jgi:hypothetical protein
MSYRPVWRTDSDPEDERLDDDAEEDEREFYDRTALADEAAASDLDSDADDEDDEEDDDVCPHGFDLDENCLDCDGPDLDLDEDDDTEFDDDEDEDEDDDEDEDGDTPDEIQA